MIVPLGAHWLVEAVFGRAVAFDIYLLCFRKPMSPIPRLEKILQTCFSHAEDILITPAAIICASQL